MRLMSYFMEVPLEIVSTPLHPALKVSLQQGRLQLSTEKAVYSYSDLYVNFRRAFSSLRLDELPIQEALLLGLGLGSIPELLEQKFGRAYRYTAVELDEGIIGLAHRYTLSKLRSAFHIVCTDAAFFVRQTPEQYDLICVDVFVDDEIPEPITSSDFMEDLRRICSPQGVVLYNCFALEKEDRRKARFVFEERFLPVFPQATYLDVGTNWILINDKQFLR